jgi:hypothetical protein
LRKQQKQQEGNMTQRRQILKASLGLAAGSSITPVLAAVIPAPDRSPAPQHFVHDRRFARACAIAQASAAAGLQVAGFEHDLLPLWQTQLLPLWQRQAVAVTGVSNGSALFLLETLGTAHGLRLARRVTLPAQAGEEPLYHWLLLPRASA